jgi:uncharacterized protein (DUF58 family)
LEKLVSHNKLLDAEAIQRAEMLGIQAREIVEGYMAGEHKSPYRGFAIEFAQHREYVPGDDTRHLDWKVLGRTDRYYIKQYEQETNYVAHILIDGSESMKYGSGHVTKFDYARTMAACLAYLILLQRDAVAVGMFDTAVKGYLPRTDNMSSIHNIMRVLTSFAPTEKTSIPAVLNEMARQVKRRGIFILMSDFFDDIDAVVRGIQHLRFGGNEVIVFQTLDPYELKFPFTGSVEFHGLEGWPRIITRPADLRKSYLAAINAFIDKLRDGCERNGCHYVKVDTSQPWHEVLSGYLAFRERTRGMR